MNKIYYSIKDPLGDFHELGTESYEVEQKFLRNNKNTNYGYIKEKRYKISQVYIREIITNQDRIDELAKFLVEQENKLLTPLQVKHRSQDTDIQQRTKDLLYVMGKLGVSQDD